MPGLTNTPKPATDDTPSTDGDKGENQGETTFTQEAVDKIVAKRVGEEKAKREDAISQAVREALAEQERQSKLTEEQKLKEAQEKQEAALAERERELSLRENRAEARELLQEKGIPAELVDWVVEPELDQTKEKITQFEKVFNEAVEAGVNAKLKGKTPADPASKGENKGRQIRSTYDLLYGN